MVGDGGSSLKVMCGYWMLASSFLGGGAPPSPLASMEVSVAASAEADVAPSSSGLA